MAVDGTASGWSSRSIGYGSWDRGLSRSNSPDALLRAPGPIPALVRCSAGLLMTRDGSSLAESLPGARRGRRWRRVPAAHVSPTRTAPVSTARISSRRDAQPVLAYTRDRYTSIVFLL